MHSLISAKAELFACLPVKTCSSERYTYTGGTVGYWGVLGGGGGGYWGRVVEALKYI